MSQRTTKSVLFLCTGNYYRSRFAEILFNHVAGKMGLGWRATSAGLALERGVNNIGPIAGAVLQSLQSMGIRAVAECARMPSQVTSEHLLQAHWIVALSDEEHRPLLLERFPDHVDRAEFWEVVDAPGVLPQIDREVMDLIARLMGGGRRREPRSLEAPAEKTCPNCREPIKHCACRAKTEPARGSKGTVKVSRETKGRRGKGVTIVSDLTLGEAEIAALAARLKERCGTGGTVKDGHIEIQGDLRDRVTTELEKLGYKIKRSGG